MTTSDHLKRCAHPGCAVFLLAGYFNSFCREHEKLNTVRKRIRRHNVLEVSAALSHVAVAEPVTSSAKGGGATASTPSTAAARNASPHRARKNIPLSKQWHIKRKMYDFARRAPREDPADKDAKE